MKPSPLSRPLEVELLLPVRTYDIDFAGHVWEVDEFLGANAGLLLAEIELDSEDAHFDLPSWIGEEVTADRRYFNSYLVAHPFSSW